MKEVGKLSVADFGSQEEWERHQREVGKLNILVSRIIMCAGLGLRMVMQSHRTFWLVGSLMGNWR